MVPTTAVRFRGLGTQCSVVIGRRAAAAARRRRAEHLLIAVHLWRNGAAVHMHRCYLPADIGARIRGELAH